MTWPSSCLLDHHLPDIQYIHVGKVAITLSATATNFGITFDEHMASIHHILVMWQGKLSLKSENWIQLGEYCM